LLDLRPALLDPSVDGVLVTLGGPAPGTLHRPAQPVVQQRPDVRGMVAHPGQPLDHDGDALQRPQLPGEPIRGGALQQGLLDPGELLI
jgi:hypothetical protein